MRVRGLEGSSGLRVRGIERSSARARVVERSSARGRGLDRARRRRGRPREIRKLAARCYYSIVHIELPVPESHVAPNYTAQL